MKRPLLFVDVADFRHFNSLHGHQAGDEVLKHVVRFSRAGLRVADILFRYGGDEFVALNRLILLWLSQWPKASVVLSRSTS